MSSCDHNFGTLRAADTNASNSNQCSNQNVDPYIAFQQIEQERAENNTHRQERCTSAFAELFEDLQRYIQQEQNSTSTAEYIQDVSPVCQNQLYQCSTFTPVQNIVQFPPHVPVQSSYPQIMSPHSSIVHQAHISFVPISNSSLKTIIKRKRKRTTFTTEQVNELEKYFSKTPYVTRQDREVLVKRLNLNDKAVKIWFQNRRLKGKRDQCRSPSSDTAMTDTSLIEFHLDNIESHINERTDRFGYVTLDDSVMDNLMNITDYCLRNKNYTKAIEDSSTECESSPIYEPISPPDSTKEDDLHCHLEEFKESLEACLF